MLNINKTSFVNVRFSENNDGKTFKPIGVTGHLHYHVGRLVNFSKPVLFQLTSHPSTNMDIWLSRNINRHFQTYLMI